MDRRPRNTWVKPWQPFTGKYQDRTVYLGARSITEARLMAAELLGAPLPKVVVSREMDW